MATATPFAYNTGGTIYDRGLTSAEILGIYNTTKSKYGL
jgi:hypothetical protein